MHYYRRVSGWNQYVKSQDESFQKIGIQLGLLRNTLCIDMLVVSNELKIPVYLISHFEKGFCMRASHQTMRHLLNYYLNKLLNSQSSSLFK